MSLTRGAEEIQHPFFEWQQATHVFPTSKTIKKKKPKNRPLYIYIYMYIAPERDRQMPDICRQRFLLQLTPSCVAVAVAMFVAVAFGSHWW